MLPLISLSPDRFSKRHSQVVAGLKSVIEDSARDQTHRNPNSLALTRFQSLTAELEQKQETIGLVHGLDNFTQGLEQEIVDVRRALLYLKKLTLTDFSEELCKYSDQFCPIFEKQILPAQRYKPFDSSLTPNLKNKQVESVISLRVVLLEISPERVSWQHAQCLDYISRLTEEVLAKKLILEDSTHKLEFLCFDKPMKEPITIQYVGRKVIELFKNHHGLLQDLGGAVRRVEETYSVRFHPYVILHVLTTAIQYRQRQLSSFLLDKAYLRIERMASDVQEAVQASISLALQMIQRYNKLMDWRRKLLDLYLSKKRQICRVRSNRYSFDQNRFLQESNPSQKSFTKLQVLTSETAQKAHQFLTNARNLLHQADELLSECGDSRSNQDECELLVELIIASFDGATVIDTTIPSAEQSLVPVMASNDQIELNSRAFASRIHLFEIEHPQELAHLLRVIQVLKLQGEVLATVNEVFSSWLQPFNQYAEKS